MGIAILLTATFAVHSPLIHAQSPAVQKAVRLLGERNEVAIAKIKTLMCSYRTEDVIPNQYEPGSYVEFPYSGQYFRKGNDFYSTCCSIEGKGHRWHVDLKKGDRRYGFQVTDTPLENPIRSQSNAVDPEKYTEFSLLWDRLQVRHSGPRDVFHTETFLNLLAYPHLILCHRLVIENGVPMEYVKLMHARGVMEFWFDPAWNGWIRKTTQEPPAASDYRNEREIKEVARSHDGAIIPTIIDRRHYDHGRLTGHARTILSDVHLNSQFHFTGLKGPTLEGSLCDDQTRGTRYLIDAIGNQIGPETIIPPRIPPEKRLYPFDLNVEIPPNGGSKDTLSTSDLAIYSAAVLACLVAIGWLIRNRRRKSLGVTSSE
jgi:hypothetical protein